MSIRQYEEKDRDNVRFVCLNSDGPDTLSPTEQTFILTTYCDYFIEKEGNNCFVATDEKDNATGYILCAENFDNFNKIFMSEFFPRLKNCTDIHRSEAKKSTLLQERYKEDYPAHLHIDLLPDYQHKGLGKQLMNTLCEHLKSKGISGVMLTVWNRNQNARNFYEKYGFTKIAEEDTSVAYGLKL